MKKAVQLIELSEEPSADLLFSLERERFASDLSGQAPARDLSFVLAISPATITLASWWIGEVYCDESFGGSKFVEGLWEKDVIELFIREEGTSRYQEFNLSPAGLWWSAVFDGYRKRSPQALAPKSAFTITDREESLSFTALTILRSEIQLKLPAPNRLAANVCAIFSQPKQQFFSVCDLGSGKPDFHKVEKICPVLIKKYSGAA